MGVAWDCQGKDLTKSTAGRHLSHVLSRAEGKAQRAQPMAAHTHVCQRSELPSSDPSLSPSCSPHTIPPLIAGPLCPSRGGGSPSSHLNICCSACFLPGTANKYHHSQCCFDPTHALMRPPGVLAWQAEVLCQNLGLCLHSHSLLLLGPHHPLASLCSAASRLES